MIPRIRYGWGVVAGSFGGHFIGYGTVSVAFGVFFLASVLTGRSAATESMRANAPRWLSVVVALGIVVIALGAYLNRI